MEVDHSPIESGGGVAGVTVPCPEPRNHTARLFDRGALGLKNQH
jgi:hypothetical protein